MDLFDWVFFICGIVFFLTIIGIFFFAKKDDLKNIQKVGKVTISLSTPLIVDFIAYIILGKDLWIIICVGLIIGYLVTDFLLDFILQIDFRTKWSRHVPYIIFEYVACFSFIYIAFEFGDSFGWVLTILFWTMMGFLIYLYSGKKKDKPVIVVETEKKVEV